MSNFSSLRYFSINTTTALRRLLIRLSTGNLRGAGTEARVFVELRGRSGVLHHRLDLPTDEELFQRDTVCNVTLSLPNSVNLDEDGIEEIVVGHDNSEVGAGWYLERVEVFDLPDNWKNSNSSDAWVTTGTEARKRLDNGEDDLLELPLTVFDCHRWLGESDCGGKSGPITRKLKPSHFQKFEESSSKNIYDTSKRTARGLKPFSLLTGTAAIPHPEKVDKR